MASEFEQLKALKPKEIFTSDNPEGLSMRRASKQGAEYRSYLDQLITKYGTAKAAQKVILAQANGQTPQMAAVPLNGGEQGFAGADFRGSPQAQGPIQVPGQAESPLGAPGATPGDFTGSPDVEHANMVGDPELERAIGEKNPFYAALAAEQGQQLGSTIDRNIKKTTTPQSDSINPFYASLEDSGIGVPEQRTAYETIMGYVKTVPNAFSEGVIGLPGLPVDLANMAVMATSWLMDVSGAEAAAKWVDNTFPPIETASGEFFRNAIMTEIPELAGIGDTRYTPQTTGERVVHDTVAGVSEVVATMGSSAVRKVVGETGKQIAKRLADRSLDNTKNIAKKDLDDLGVERRGIGDPIVAGKTPEEQLGKVTESVKKLSDDIGAKADAETIGSNIAKGRTKLMDDINDVKNQTYDEFDNLVQQSHEFSPSQTPTGVGKVTIKPPTVTLETTTHELGLMIKRDAENVGKPYKYVYSSKGKPDRMLRAGSDLSKAGDSPGMIRVAKAIMDDFKKGIDSYSWEEVKRLRTKIGAKINDGLTAGDMTAGDAKQLWKWLSQDMEIALKNRPKELALWKKASSLTKIGFKREEQLTKALGKVGKTSAEIYNMVKTATRNGGDSTKLIAIFKVLNKTQKNLVRRDMWDRMIKQDAKKFLKEYDEMNDRVRKLMFGSINVSKNVNKVRTAVRQVEKHAPTFGKRHPKTVKVVLGITAAAIIGPVGAYWANRAVGPIIEAATGR